MCKLSVSVCVYMCVCVCAVKDSVGAVVSWKILRLGTTSNVCE